MRTIPRFIVVRTITIVIGALLLATSVAAQTETVEYYGLDALGSVRVVFDANGNVVGRADYGPFGESLVTGSGMPSRAYAGLFRDGEAGLDHAEARSYQSRTGRFTTVDPAYAGLFTPQEWNRYAYVSNNPLGNVDPSGACPDGWICFNWLDIVMGKLFGNTTGGGASGGSGGGGESATHDQTRSGPGGGGGGQTRPAPPSDPPPRTDPPPKAPLPPPKPEPPKPTPVQKARQMLCSALPAGRTFGLGGALGFLAGGSGTIESVVNYDTGEASLFLSGGLQGGWNGAAQGNAFLGFVYGSLGAGNANYAGPFTSGSVSVNAVSVFAQRGGGVRVFGASVGASLVPAPLSANMAQTMYSRPIGTMPAQLLGSDFDKALIALRQMCH